jgi:SAM-dependent methyltransferase
MDLLRFAVTLNAGIAVLVPEGDEAAPLHGARVLGIPITEARDGAGLVARLRELRAADRFEFVMVPAAARNELADEMPQLEATFEQVGADEGGAVLYSLFERPPEMRTADDGLPLPPVHLVRVTSGCAHQARRNLAQLYRSFYETGAQAADWIRATVARAGADVEAMDAVLDFGCGCGRVIRHWGARPPFELHGCDYNPYLVRWCADNLSFARFAVNQLQPPLPYEDDRFDLVYSISIFTHLDDALQRPWIEELGRIIRPGGLALVTLQGAAMAARVLNDSERARFDAGELVVKRSDLAGRNACSAFHPERYVRDELARGFELLEHELSDARQDAVLLRVPV